MGFNYRSSVLSRRRTTTIWCGKLAVVADPLEQLVCEGVLDRLDSPELAAALRGEAQSDPEAARCEWLGPDRRAVDAPSGRGPAVAGGQLPRPPAGGCRQQGRQR